jgi:integrase
MALRFLILTAARSGEVRGATWSEIDLKKSRWTIPATRMKAEREHVVPLSTAAVQILTAAAELRRSDSQTELVFPNSRGKPLSDAALLKALRGQDRNVTVHGFRSTFRDWVADQRPEYSDAVAEAALAHTNRNKTEAAYRRTTFLERRIKLMEDWAIFLCSDGLRPNTAQVGSYVI